MTIEIKTDYAAGSLTVMARVQQAQLMALEHATLNDVKDALVKGIVDHILSTRKEEIIAKIPLDLILKEAVAQTVVALTKASQSTKEI
jgi:hypothetical protein